MNEINQLYKKRIEELTQRLEQRVADTTLAAFYANESILNILESYIEFLQYIDSCNTPSMTIHGHAKKRLEKWSPVLERVKAQADIYRQRIQDLGLAVD